MEKLHNIALIGQSNSGKSTLFKLLSDIKSTRSGATYDTEGANVYYKDRKYGLIDLPGVYSLNTNNAAELISFDYLINGKADLIINVVDASQLSRSLELTVELVELGIPMIIALNMIDEAERQGIKVDSDKLQSILGVKVVEINSRQGKGGKELIACADDMLRNNVYHPNKIEFVFHLEEDIKKLEQKIVSIPENLSGSLRFYAIKTLENPESISNLITDKVKNLRDEIENELIVEHKRDGYETISYERHHHAMNISEAIIKIKSGRKVPLKERFDSYLLHPVWGFIFLISFFGVYFLGIFVIGDFLSGLISTPLGYIPNQYAALNDFSPFIWTTVNGAWLGVEGILGIVLPYFLPLVFLTAIFEETGYLSRVAYLMDGLFHKIGLHGKSVVPFILGFGCSIPAIYATRMIENRRDRIITSILIPFVPCSARIAVIFALAAAFTGPIWAIVVFMFVLLIIAIHGKILSKFLTDPIGLILDIPALRLPSAKHAFRNTWLKTKDFIKEAFTFLLIGSIILSWIEFFNLAVYVNSIFAPIVEFVLGLPEELGSTLVFGFFRKELIIVMANQALGVPTLADLPMSVSQVVVFIIFVTLYFPCFTTFVVILKEFKYKVAIFSALLSIVVATISALLFRLLLNY